MLAARSPRDAEQMSSVLHVVSAIERLGNAAVDIARIVTHRLGIPAALVADLAAAEEVSHRVRVRRELAARRRARWPTSSSRSRWACGSWPSGGARSGSSTPTATRCMVPDDVLILRGSPDGIAELRELAGAPEWRPPTVDEDPAITDLDRAVDVLVEMKNISEVAVGLAYSALLFNDQSLAAEVSHLEDRLDEMRERLEVWVLRSAADEVDPSPLRGLLHLGAAAEEIGDAAQQMVWLVEEGEEMHPIVGRGARRQRRGDRPGAGARRLARSTGARSREAQLEIETGFYLLAIRRAGRYLYRPRGQVRARSGRRAHRERPRRGAGPRWPSCAGTACSRTTTPARSSSSLRQHA